MRRIRARRVVAVATLAAAFLVAVSARPATAQSVAKLDPRALGMGGAYVAVADGWAAVNWNPAGLFVGGRREVALALGQVPLEGGAWVEALRQARTGDGSPADALALLGSEGAGLAGERPFGVYLTSTRWGLGFQQIHFTDELARVVNGRVEVRAASLRTRELMLAAAQPTAQGRVVVGGVLKYVSVEARDRLLDLDDLPETRLEAGELLELSREGPAGDAGAFTADLGLLLVPSYRLRIGAVVRNITSPEIDTGIDAVRELPRQIRVGAMVRLHPMVSWSADLDVDSDPFLEGGRRRREVATGIEVAGRSAAVRGGLLVDLEAVDRQPLFTLGLGVGGEEWAIDGAATWAPDRDGIGWLGALVAEW